MRGTRHPDVSCARQLLGCGRQVGVELLVGEVYVSAVVVGGGAARVVVRVSCSWSRRALGEGAALFAWSWGLLVVLVGLLGLALVVISRTASSAFEVCLYPLALLSK